MAELTVLEEKLAEVIGLAMAAQGATEKIESLTEDEELTQQLERMTTQAQAHVPVIGHDVLTLARCAQQRYALGDLGLDDQG